jgi:hypothetical protein
MPALGISACSLCNFITIPRLIEAMSGEYRGMVFLVSSVGLVNLGLLLLTKNSVVNNIRLKAMTPIAAALTCTKKSSQVIPGK